MKNKYKQMNVSSSEFTFFILSDLLTELRNVLYKVYS